MQHETIEESPLGLLPVIAGRTGWRTIIQEPWSGATAHIFLSLLPMALVTMACLYFAVLLWRYGSFYSMVIYPSIINPWIYPIFGTIFMGAGQVFGPDLFPILSNSGILIYLLTVQRVLVEVRTDMDQAGDLGKFLDAIGDDNVTGAVTPKETTTWRSSLSQGGGALEYDDNDNGDVESP